MQSVAKQSSSLLEYTKLLCLQVPNLKTRLASAREEFRATFRGEFLCAPRTPSAAESERSCAAAGYQQNYQSDAFHTL